VVVEAAAGLLALVDVEHRCVDSAVLALTRPQAGHETGGYTKNLDGNLDVASPVGIFIVVTCYFVVELPGIEPGSYGIPSRLLRAQFAMPLLGSPDHANKSG
jgi:hypothetical protein